MELVLCQISFSELNLIFGTSLKDKFASFNECEAEIQDIFLTHIYTLLQPAKPLKKFYEEFEFKVVGDVYKDSLNQGKI